MYEKTIVCLAASARDRAFCIAGKEYDNGTFGDWIRPVSSIGSRAISNYERRKNTGGFTQVLDVVTVYLDSPNSYTHHSENHTIEEGQVWMNRGSLTKTDIIGAVDNVTGLWHNGDSSSGGINDRVPLEHLRNVQSSLALIEPEELVIEKIHYRKFRAKFCFQGVPYNLAMTDPIIGENYRDKGCHSVPDALICVSLAELIGLYGRYAYKLVASVII